MGKIWFRRTGRHLRGSAGGVIALVCLVLAGQAARAATPDGQYAIRGAALLPCSAFMRERATGSTVYQTMAAWVDGYISGINQQAPGMFDVASFETTELIAALLSEHCSKNPDDPLYAVVALLVNRMAQNALDEVSQKVEVRIGERNTLLYKTTIRRMQQQLGHLGLFNSDEDGQFGAALREAIAAYQRSIDLNPTGFPDQLTLWRLFKPER
jgi:hypothetical protein